MIFKKLLAAALPMGLAFGLSACGGDETSTPVVPNTPVVETSSASTEVTPVVASSASTAVTPVVSGKTYGLLPATANATNAMNWYALWKATYFKTYEEEAAKYPTAAASSDWTAVFGSFLTAGLMPGRVIWDTNSDSYCVIEGATDSYKKRGCTVSEGVGYGMLLSFFAGDYTTLNDLWTYNRGYRTYQGTNLMPWRTGTYSYESLGSAANTSSATDADLDIATALILTYYATGVEAYKTDALLIISQLWDDEISPTQMIYSGNTPTWKKETSAYNLSYFSPVALKLFALVDPSHDWTGVLNTMYNFMINIQTAGTGVFPDWVNSSGVAINPNNGSADKTYWMFHQESVRIPWRIAWDYYWTQDTRAAQVLNTLNNFISVKTGGDPANLETAAKVMYSAVSGMEDGTAATFAPHWHGAWCLTGMASNQAWIDACTTNFNTRTISGFSYFPHILMTMYGELLNGLFVKPANLPF